MYIPEQCQNTSKENIFLFHIYNAEGSAVLNAVCAFNTIGVVHRRGVSKIVKISFIIGYQHTDFSQLTFLSIYHPGFHSLLNKMFFHINMLISYGGFTGACEKSRYSL